jgi:hypothetical protein
MGLPPRSLAADAHDCIMVRSRSGICRIQGRGARSLRSTLAGSPQIVLSLLAQAKRHPTRPEPAAVLGPVKKWPGNAAAR